MRLRGSMKKYPSLKKAVGGRKYPFSCPPEAESHKRQCVNVGIREFRSGIGHTFLKKRFYGFILETAISATYSP